MGELDCRDKHEVVTTKYRVIVSHSLGGGEEGCGDKVSLFRTDSSQLIIYEIYFLKKMGKSERVFKGLMN